MVNKSKGAGVGAKAGAEGKIVGFYLVCTIV